MLFLPGFGTFPKSTRAPGKLALNLGTLLGLLLGDRHSLLVLSSYSQSITVRTPLPRNPRTLLWTLLLWKVLA